MTLQVEVLHFILHLGLTLTTVKIWKYFDIWLFFSFVGWLK